MMAEHKEWAPYEGFADEMMMSGDARTGIKNVRLCFTLKHLDPAKEEEVEVRLPSDSMRLQQEQEIVYVGDTPTPTGKKRARVHTWEGMESFEDFKQPAVPQQVISQNAGEAFVRVGSPASGDDNTGFNVAPTRYSAAGRETIDRIRDQASDWLADALATGCSVADAAFAVHCASCAFKYRDRKGLKGPADEDEMKARWYEQMFEHLCGRGPDPRSYRDNYVPYTPPEEKP